MIRGSIRRSEWAFCALLALATLGVYSGLLNSDFVRFDDPRYVTKNPRVLAGLSWDNTVWAFTTLFKSNWQPLAWLSHMLDVELFALNAAGHHATSLLLHVVNSLLLFAVLRSATGAFGPAAAVSALFALHPSHVESVAWVSERKDVLSTCFGLLATAAYLGYARHGGAGRYAATAALLFASLASKAMLVTLPFVFLLLDYWPLRRFGAGGANVRVVVEKLPLLLMVGVVAGVTLAAQSQSGAVAIGEEVAFHHRVANAVMAYGLYLWKSVWPADLALVYPHPYLPGGVPWQAWQVVATGTALAAISAGVCNARSRRYLAVGWFWFLGTLVPVIGLVQVGSQGLADRYTYFPCIGLYIMVAWGVADLSRVRAAGSTTRLHFAVGAVGVAVISALGISAQRQAAHWRDTISLFEHSLRIAPGATSLRNNLANEFFDLGRMDEAISQYQQVVEFDPGMDVAHRNLANALRRRGEIFEANRHALIGRRVPLDSLEGQLGLGAGRLAEADPAKAEAHFRNALALAPDSDDAHRGLAQAQLAQGDIEAAVLEFRAVVSLKPDSVADHIQLGHALSAQGSPGEAIEHYRRAAAVAPGVALANQVLAEALMLQGEFDEAVAFYRRAVAADPRDRFQSERLADALRLRAETRAGETPNQTTPSRP